VLGYSIKYLASKQKGEEGGRQGGREGGREGKRSKREGKGKIMKIINSLFLIFPILKLITFAF
jgi:hypothetical protein